MFFIGFDLVTSFFSIFIPNISQVSQSITIPYRGFALFLSISVIFITKKRANKYNAGFILLVAYLFLFTIRLIYDYLFRADIYIGAEIAYKNGLFYFSMIIAIYSFVKSYRFIDLSDAFKWIYFGFSIIVLMNFLVTPEYSLANVDELNQISSGLRNTINSGYLASHYLLMSVFFINTKAFPKVLKIASLPVILMAILILLRSGSRGPLMALVIAFFIYLILTKKHVGTIVLFVGMLSIGFYYYFYDILELIGRVAPVMTNRIQSTIDSGGQEKRIEFFLDGINAFLEYPFFGSKAMIYSNSKIPDFPHQLIIEAFMSTGIVGGISFTISFILLVKMIIGNLFTHVSNYWLELILIAYLVRAMSAGSIFSFDYPIIFSFYFLVRNKNYISQA